MKVVASLKARASLRIGKRDRELNDRGRWRMERREIERSRLQCTSFAVGQGGASPAHPRFRGAQRRARSSCLWHVPPTPSRVRHCWLWLSGLTSSPPSLTTTTTSSSLHNPMARFGLLLFLAAALGGVAATPLDEQVVFPGAPDERWSWKDCGKHQVVIQASATQP